MSAADTIATTRALGGAQRLTLERLEALMRAGEQASGVSYWDHGTQVRERFQDLMRDEPRLEWRLPPWFAARAAWVRAQLAPLTPALAVYHQWHDLGKPLCRTVDEDGRVHYPGHAAVSAAAWRALGGDPLVGELIARDMDAHLLRPDGCAAFASGPHALALLVTALAETHANAPMFGGFDSDSFKIKMKRLAKCGERVIIALQGEQQ